MSTADNAVPGWISHDRSNACTCPTLSQPASFAVRAAVMTSPAATDDQHHASDAEEARKLMRTPPR